MGSPIERHLAVTYGGYTVGGSTERQVHSYTQVRQSFVESVVRFSFLVTGFDDEEFAAECRGAEEAFRTPHQNLTVSQDGAVLLDLNHDQATGFNADPEIEKQEHEADTGRSRMYHVTITFGMPADNSSPTGIREATVGVEYSPSRRRTLTIDGVWTANNGTDSRAAYEAGIDAFVSSVRSALGGTWETVAEDVAPDKEDKVANFTHTSREIIFQQGGSTLNDPGIVEQQLRVAPREEAPGDWAGEPTTRPKVVDVSYDAWVDADVTTNLAAKWQSIRSWVIGQATSLAGGGNGALTMEEPAFFPDDNRISAKLTLTVMRGNLLEQSIHVTDKVGTGKVLVPVWSGNQTDRYRFDGPATLQRVVRHTMKRFGRVTQPAAAQIAYGRAVMFQQEEFYVRDVKMGAGKVWVVVSRDVDTAQNKLGAAGHQQTVTDIVASTTMELYTEADSGGGGTLPLPETTPGQGGAPYTPRNRDTPGRYFPPGRTSGL